MPATILSDNGASSGTAGLKTSGSNDGILELQTTTGGGTATAAITIDTDQRSKFPTTIGVGGATPATSGSGISFPATASASSDANTLDDYEEGTWTPAMTSGGSSVTLVDATGKYRKVGSLVYIDAYMEISGTGYTGDLNFTNLPFTVLNSTSVPNGIVRPLSLNSGLGSSPLFAQPGPNTTVALFLKMSSGSSALAQGGDLANGGQVRFGFSYIASA
jgi:hypothetical protein